MNIEPLEARIAPATLVNPTTLTYTDIDGDLVTVTTSAGAFVFTNPPSGTAFTDTFVLTTPNLIGGQQLQLIDLRQGSGFQNANLTVSVVKAGAGDGLAAIGLIYAPGIDLGIVSVKGDLGEIDCGDGDTATPGLKALSVRSMGRYGDATDALIPGVTSDIAGALGALRVAEDMKEASILVTATVDADARIGSIFIGGALIGGAGDGTGMIHAEGTIGPVTIGRDLVGGAGSDTGQIDADGKMGAVSIGGSVVGAAGAGSGQIDAGGDITSLRLGGSLIGGTGFDSGTITGRANVGPVSIGGSLLGGAGEFSGSLIVTGTLGAVKIAHDVKGAAGLNTGKIDAGGKLASLAIAGSLLGGSGHYDAAGNFRQISAIGGAGAITIGHDVTGGAGDGSARIGGVGALGNITIGGSLLGGAGVTSGRFDSETSIGAVKIGHDLAGGGGTGSGSIESDGRITSLTIGGSLIGGAGNFSGHIESEGELGQVTIGHDLLGGTDDEAGVLRSDARIVGVRIGGSLVGGSVSGTGTADVTGAIIGGGGIGAVRIGHDFVGGSISGTTAALERSGFIEAARGITSIFIGGSFIAGTDASSAGALARSATIRAGDGIGSLTVKGSLVGNVGPQGDSLVTISARGQATPGATTDVAIGKIAIGARVEFAQIFAGYDRGLAPKNADAQIGAVTVGADWIASSIVAGAMNPGPMAGSGDDNRNFGDFRDAKIVDAGESATITSRIGSITIGGQVFGTPASFSDTDRYGFVAEEIGKLKIGTKTFALDPGAGNDAVPLGFFTQSFGFTISAHEIGKLFGSTTLPVAAAQRVNASTLAYTDVDGDHVTVKLSQPLLTSDAVANSVFVFDQGAVGGADVPGGQQLQLIDVRTLVAATNGLSVTVTVVPGGGDGLANVGAILSSLDLGTVTIPGDLGQISAGDMTAATIALGALNVRTLGRLGLDAQPAMSLTFVPFVGGEIIGGLGSLMVKQDVAGSDLAVTGALGAVTIGGSLIGGAITNSGTIVTSQEIGAVKIGHHIQAGANGTSGFIDAGTSIASVRLGGSLIGGSVNADGATLGAVTIAHNVIGGFNDSSGRLNGNTGVGAVSIGGSLLAGSGDFSGRIASGGDIGAVKIGHNVASADGDESGKIDSSGKLTSLTIRGSLIGGSGDQDTGAHSGQVFAVSDIGAVVVGHNVSGGSGSYSAAIRSNAALASATIGGSLLGRAGFFSGSLNAKDLGAVKIAHDVIGGTNGAGGYIEGFDSIAKVTIGGSLVGGASANDGQVICLGPDGIGPVKVSHDVLGGPGGDSGAIRSAMRITGVTIGGSLAGGSSVRAGSITGGDLGPVKIGRDLIGGSIAGTTANLDSTGYIEGTGRIASVSVGGSIIAGSDDSTGGALTKNASIRAANDLGTLSVKGSLIGNVAPNGTSLVVISARGQAAPVGDSNVAIGKLTIGGRVERANIFAGFTTNLVPMTDGVQIGAVKVGREWIASNLVCGVQNFGTDGDPGGAPDNVNFGDGFDTPIVTGSITNRIASIIIRGAVVGSDTGGDHFGFSAVEIASFKSLGFTAPLIAGASDDIIELSPLTGDVTLREI